MIFPLSQEEGSTKGFTHDQQGCPTSPRRLKLKLELRPDFDRWPKAEERLREELADQERELGLRNIVALTTRVAIGWAMAAQGKAVEARDHANNSFQNDLVRWR